MCSSSNNNKKAHELTWQSANSTGSHNGITNVNDNVTFVLLVWTVWTWKIFGDLGSKQTICKSMSKHMFHPTTFYYRICFVFLFMFILLASTQNPVSDILSWIRFNCDLPEPSSGSTLKCQIQSCRTAINNDIISDRFAPHVGAKLSFRGTHTACHCWLLTWHQSLSPSVLGMVTKASLSSSQ